MSYDPKLREAIDMAIEKAFTSGVISREIKSYSAEKYLQKRKKQITKEFFKLLREGETK